MFIAAPVKYSFIPDQNFHTLEIIGKWKETQDRALEELVCASLSKNRIKAIENLRQNVENYLLSLPDLENGYIRLQDFKYSYNIIKIDKRGNVVSFSDKPIIEILK